MTSKLTRAARGQDCTLRLVPCAPAETVVLAHLPMGIMGGKAPDWWGVDACFHCHNVLDRRDERWREFEPYEIRAACLRALGETITRRMSMGLIEVKA